MPLSKLSYKNRWFYYLGVYVYVIVLYTITNQQTLRPPHRLPLTFIDQNTPFLPWTAWIYIMVYVVPLSVGFVVKKVVDIKRAIYSFCAMATVCTIVFAVYPTVYPRPATQPDGGSVALTMVHAMDTPLNCMPSQHVALGFLAAFFVHHYRRRWGNAAIVLAILIAISTLTTKQHYVWDVVAGYALARLMFVVFMKWGGGSESVYASNLRARLNER